jgi:predicted permease
MYEIAGLIFPLFGLILLGFIAARITGRPLDELGWLNTFIVYVALPALFFRMLSRTPIEQLASWDFIGANLAVTFSIFVLTFALGLIATRGLVPSDEHAIWDGCPSVLHKLAPDLPEQSRCILSHHKHRALLWRRRPYRQSR